MILFWFRLDEVLSAVVLQAVPVGAMTPLRHGFADPALVEVPLEPLPLEPPFAGVFFEPEVDFPEDLPPPPPFARALENNTAATPSSHSCLFMVGIKEGVKSKMLGKGSFWKLGNRMRLRSTKFPDEWFKYNGTSIHGRLLS